MRPYIIWTPPWDATSGGIMVLYHFCHEMNVRGYEAYINSSIPAPYLYTPFYNRNLENPIAVYPEIIRDNPLGCNTVARWLLNNAGKLLRQDASFFPTGELFAFSHMFNDQNLPEERIMFLPIIGTDIYRDTKQPRDKVLFYVGKGWGTPREEIPGAIEIYKETGFNPQALAYLLQTGKVLYCYDNITAMTELARLCGCPVVLIPNGEYTEEKYKEHEMGMDGLGWGKMPEPFDSDTFRERYMTLKETFYTKLDNFVRITQNV